jgi:hypothetical protein
MSYAELVIALFVIAVLFIAFTYEDPRVGDGTGYGLDSKNPSL